MKKTFKKITASIMAVTTLAVSAVSMGVNAESVTNYRSTGGDYGYMYYNLSTTGSYISHGIYSYRLSASSIQTLPNGGSYLPIKQIKYNAAIYLNSGGLSTSNTTFTSRDANWNAPIVAASAVTTDSEKGYITHTITSEHYGNIIKTLKNI